MKILLFLTAAYIFIGITSVAQCDNSLKPDNNIAISYKKMDNRCEGYYEAKVSNPSMQVVGLLKGKFRYKYDDKNEIISVYSTLNDRTINLRAIGVPLDTYYQMDAQIEPLKEFKWPVEDFLYPNKLRSQCIKIFGWTGSEENKIYVPVITEPFKSTVSNDSLIRLYVRTSTDISLVNWRYSVLINGSYGQYGEYIKIDQRFKAGKSIPIELLNISGNLSIEILARKTDSNEWIRKVIQVLIDEE